MKYNWVGSEKKIIKGKQYSVKCDIFFNINSYEFLIVLFFRFVLLFLHTLCHPVHVSHSVKNSPITLGTIYFKKPIIAEKIIYVKKFEMCYSTKNIHKMKIKSLLFSAGTSG